jgi:hypothetical protein
MTTDSALVNIEVAPKDGTLTDDKKSLVSNDSNLARDTLHLIKLAECAPNRSDSKCTKSRFDPNE